MPDRMDAPSLTLARIRVSNFRRISKIDVQIPEHTKIICLVGRNGSGKSSLMSYLIDGLCRLTHESAPDLDKSNRKADEYNPNLWRRNFSNGEITRGSTMNGFRTDWLVGGTPSTHYCFVRNIDEIGQPSEILPDISSELYVQFSPGSWVLCDWTMRPPAHQDPVSCSVFLVRPADRSERPHYEEPMDVSAEPKLRSNWESRRTFPIRVRTLGPELEQIILDMLLGSKLGDPVAEWFMSQWKQAWLRLVGSDWKEEIGDFPFRRVGGMGLGPMSILSAGELDILVTVALILIQQFAIARRFSQYNWPGKNGPSGIVFIDEIDAHLHPQWQELALPLLNDLFPNILFIVTTHSPFVLRSLPKEHSLVLRCPDGEVFKSEFSAWQIDDILNSVFEVSPTWNDSIRKQLKNFEKLVLHAYEPEQIATALENYRVLVAHDSEGLRAECRKIVTLYGTREFQEALSKSINDA